MDRDARFNRVAVLASLGLVAINLATTARWANVPGAMRGWRWPFIIAAIVVVALAEVRRRATPTGSRPRLQRALLVSGVALLAAEFLIEWFPPATWRLVPFLDDWPPRFSSTVEGIALLKRGTLAGWQWNLLGGYATATDVTQSLAVLGAVPMILFGDAIGFHLLHLLLFLAIPVLVFLDLRGSGVAVAASGLAAWYACTFSWGIIRAGDSNSLAGVVGVLAVLAASHWARAGGAPSAAAAAGTPGGPSPKPQASSPKPQASYGFVVLVAALTLTACSHLGFLSYAIGLLLLESVYYRDRGHLYRCVSATALALVASAPVTFELVRYPEQFNFNNVMYERPDPIDWPSVARRVGYNAQILLSPRRWFSDTTKLFAPILLLAAWKREGRVGFYAWAALFVLGLTVLNVAEAGYVFQRPAHLLVVFTPIVLAWFVSTRAAGTVHAACLTALVILTMPIASGFGVPHLPSVDAFAPHLIDRIKAAEGDMVLLENNPHRGVAVPPGRSEKSLYGTHYESLVPAATGKRLYAGYWDGWQFTPFRGEMLAAGAWQGHVLSEADHAALVAELRRWGIRRLFVWSNTSNAVLSAWPELVPRWEEAPWREFEFVDPLADGRSVVTVSGRGELAERDQLGGVVRLTDVRRGDRVVVRMHYHPAWQADGPAGAVRLVDVAGQLGFAAPASGSYDVRLRYPPRRWLLVLSGLALALSLVWTSLIQGRR